MISRIQDLGNSVEMHRGQNSKILTSVSLLLSPTITTPHDRHGRDSEIKRQTLSSFMMVLDGTSNRNRSDNVNNTKLGVTSVTTHLYRLSIKLTNGGGN
jgi:hypothetical protein